MNGNLSALSVELDALTVRFFSRLLKGLVTKWGVSKEEAIRLAVKQANDSSEALEDPLTDSEGSVISLLVEPHMFDQIGRKLEEPLTDRDAVVIHRFIEGYTWDEIALELGEDPRLTRFRWYRFMSKVRRRLKDKVMADGAARVSDRLEAFKALQQSLNLTPAKAAEWQDAVREARR